MPTDPLTPPSLEEIEQALRENERVQVGPFSPSDAMLTRIYACLRSGYAILSRVDRIAALREQRKAARHYDAGRYTEHDVCTANTERLLQLGESPK